MWVAIAYWAIGSLLFGSLRDGRLNSCARVGVGGVIGLATFFLMSWLPRVADTGFWVVSTYSLLLAVLFLALTKARKTAIDQARAFTYHTRELTFWVFGLGIVILAVAGFEIAISNSNPIFAWDALTMWARRAQLYAQYLQGSGWARDFQWAEHRHPLTLSYVLATLRYFDGTSQASLSFFAPYFLAKISMALICAGAVHSLQLPLRMLIALLAFTIPIVSNHVGIPGYSDYWLALFSLCSIIIASSMPYIEFKAYFLVGAIVLLLATAAMKNVGWVLSLLAVVSIFLSANFNRIITIFRRNKSKIYFTTALVLAFVGALAIFVLADEEVEVKIGGRFLVLSLNALYSIPESIIHAFFNNISFTTIGLIAILSAFASRVHVDPTERALLIYFILTMAVHLVIMATQYGLQTTAATSDLGGTRFLMTPILVIFVFSISRLCRDFSKQE